MATFQAMLRAKFKYGAKVLAAAQQMRKHVVQGKAFEIPAAMSTDDATSKAVLCLQELYPEVPVVFQSRGLVIGMVEQTMKVSKGAWDELKKAGYFAPADAAKNAEAFLDKHTEFINRNEQSVEENVKEGQRRQAARDAIVLDGHGKLAVAEKPAAFADGRTFAEVAAEDERARSAEQEKFKGVVLNDIATGIKDEKGNVR